MMPCILTLLKHGALQRLASLLGVLYFNYYGDQRNRTFGIEKLVPTICPLRSSFSLGILLLYSAYLEVLALLLLLQVKTSP